MGLEALYGALGGIAEYIRAFAVVIAHLLEPPLQRAHPGAGIAPFAHLAGNEVLPGKRLPLVQKQEHGAVGLATGIEAVGGLESHHRQAGGVAEHAVGLALIVAQVAQGLLHLPHAVAGLAAYERFFRIAFGHGEQVLLLGKRAFACQRLQRGLVQPAGDLQAIGGLEILHGHIQVFRVFAQITKLGQARRGVHRLRQSPGRQAGERNEHCKTLFQSLHEINLRCALST